MYWSNRQYSVSKKKNIENITILPRAMTIDAIKNTTHLVVTAPPEGNKCPILSKYEKEIKNQILEQ